MWNKYLMWNKRQPEIGLRSQAIILPNASDFHTPCGRERLPRFTREDRAYAVSRLPKKSGNDCFI